VVLDLFGTLLEMSPSTVGSAVDVLQHLHDRRWSVEVDELVRRAEGRDGEAFVPGPLSLPDFVRWQDGAWEDAARYAGVRMDNPLRSLLWHVVKTRRLDLYPDALPALTRLARAGVPWFVCSNASPDVGPKLDTLLPAHLRPVHKVLSWQVGARKPHQRMYEAVLARLDCAPGEVLFVGDRVACDVDAPRRFGFRSVLVTRGLGGRRPDTWPDLSPLAEGGVPSGRPSGGH
jgi:HAD superfamily hydrolase (TIGR01509 family)